MMNSTNWMVFFVSATSLFQTLNHFLKIDKGKLSHVFNLRL